MFRRRRAADDADVATDADGVLDDPAPDEPDALDVDPVDVVPAEPQPTAGPWDLADLPDGDETPRVDLGGLHLPIPEGVELRVEMAEDVLIAAALVDGNSQLMVHAFAAPKSSGIWDEVRDEIAGSLRESGGSAEASTGPFGHELRARIPDESGGTQPARFLGVDGPRWFLRGLLSGPAATDPAQARRLEGVFRGIVVHRGGDAMAPRDPLPLHLPREALDSMAADAVVDEAPQLELRERGPEITELR